MRAVVAWAWQVYPELKRLEAAVYSWNPASTKVLQKIGFVEEGRLRAAISKMGKTCDMIVFGQVRDTLEITTAAPAEEPSS
jgi:[ribosomal protein S5]-alanine N-acetyltransferase